MKLHFSIAKRHHPYLLCIHLLLCVAPGFGKELTQLLPDPRPPQFIDNGNGLRKGVPVKAVINDPSPQTSPQLQIPVPDSFKNPNAKALSTFSISYVPLGASDSYGATCLPFPEKARAALSYSTSVWAGVLTSPVPITIRACWSDLGNATVLGYSGIGVYRKDFQGAKFANTWYGASLANSMAGYDLDPDITDINITYNSRFSWYFGLDAHPASYQHDFVTVVLHEIGHGLNFSGLVEYNSRNGIGSWGFNTGSPGIFDLFIRDGNGNHIINTAVYNNNSTELGKALQSNNLWFHGSNAMRANNNNRVKIYTPTTWRDGSSYSHLDYNTFNNTEHQLMTYALSPGEAVHDPGGITRGLLEDLGWHGASTNYSLQAPTSIKASDGKCLRRIIVSWTPAPNAKTYTLFRCTNTSETSCVPFATTPETTIHDTAIHKNTLYFYRVKSNKDMSQSSFSNLDSGYASGSKGLCAPTSSTFPLLIKQFSPTRYYQR